jgi:hypothetical protein
MFSFGLRFCDLLILSFLLSILLQASITISSVYPVFISEAAVLRTNYPTYIHFIHIYFYLRPTYTLCSNHSDS